MYFNHSNNFFHGIMFHHFHDKKSHSKSQGSISEDDLLRLIKFIGRKNILNAEIFYEKLKSGSLKKNEVCFTFDDGIKCQIDVALPVLEDQKIKAFFFAYSSIFEGKPDNLEIFRHFRMNFFKDINDFYKDFYLELNTDLTKFFKINEEAIKLKLEKFPMYSLEDIKFRFVRDFYLTREKYDDLMIKMINKKNIDIKDLYSKLLFSKEDLRTLDKLGHLIGLHSHSHPTKLEKLDFNSQKKEYDQSSEIISKILDKDKNEINCMSHPSGSYNKDTLKILKDMGIGIGFKQVMKIEPEKGMSKINNSNLEIAREDHINIIKNMEK